MLKLHNSSDEEGQGELNPPPDDSEETHNIASAKTTKLVFDGANRTYDGSGVQVVRDFRVERDAEGNAVEPQEQASL